MLRLERVCVGYDAPSPILAGVSLTVASGELVAVVGPSGCGKSTLLRAVAGLVPPASGTIQVDRSQLGFVFQDPTLLPWRTVLGNVELLAELHDIDRAQRRRLAEDALALVGLRDAAALLPSQLSGGMQMRVSLARALVLQPSLFLLDEPFGALDELTRERLNAELLTLHDRAGFAGLLVTHSVTEAVYLADRVLVMGAGRFAAEIDVPFERPRPADLRFDASFAGVAREVSTALRLAAPDLGGRQPLEVLP